MTIDQLKIELEKSHQLFVDFLIGLDDESCIKSENRKWSPLQNAEHISKSLWMMNLGLQTPKFLLKLFFGTSKNKSMTYDGLIAFYKAKLKAGAKADLIYHPKKKYYAKDIKKITDSLVRNFRKTIDLLSDFSEDDLDTLKIAHPILGKITLREMLYFTVYHVSHHHNNSKNLVEITK